MQTGYLDTIIKIELVIVLAHRNSGPYRCCTWFVNLGSGATAIEYGLIAALVSVAAIGALTAMGNSLELMFGSVANTLEAAVGS